MTTASLIWTASQTAPTSNMLTAELNVANLTDHSYSGNPNRVLNINADGVAVGLDDFAGKFWWMDLEGTWCAAGLTRPQTIRSGQRSRTTIAS